MAGEGKRGSLPLYIHVGLAGVLSKITQHVLHCYVVRSHCKPIEQPLFATFQFVYGFFRVRVPNRRSILNLWSDNRILSQFSYFFTFCFLKWTFYFNRPLLSALEGHLVSAEKTWCGGVDCVTGPGDHVCQCVELCPCW